ncbi:MAG: hypothetical protein AAGM22_16555 [Acidobacteriota bacterium]
MENRVFLIVAALIALVVAIVLFQPAVEEQLAPKLDSAWVAIEVEGSNRAEVGRFELREGEKFTLRAVAGAQARDGSRVYYTEAESLVIDGQSIPTEQLRRWDRSKPLKIRWYTVEGRYPYFPIDDDEGIRTFEFQEFLRSDWPLTWSVPGDIDAAHDDHLERSPYLQRQRFGTQRYQARIELYRRSDDLVPERVIDSWGVSGLKTQLASFPTVVMKAQGGAGLASSVFGLTQLDPPSTPSDTLRSQIDELARAGIAFTRLTLLRDLAAAAGVTFATAPWRPVELVGTQAFGDGGVAAGDLLRVGDRVVVLFEDRGEAGVLDYEDLCFDLVQGIEVRALGEVFSGEGLDVEWASLATGASGAAGASDSTDASDPEGGA